VLFGSNDVCLNTVAVILEVSQYADHKPNFTVVYELVQQEVDDPDRVSAKERLFDGILEQPCPSILQFTLLCISFSAFRLLN
jgi:hypothetical protein